MRQPISGVRPATRRSIPSTVTMGSNTRPACMSRRRRSFWIVMELFVHRWNALNSLPEVQGIRVEAHLILGKSYRQIAREQGVDKSAVRHSVKSGKAAMRKYLKKFL